MNQINEVNITGAISRRDFGKGALVTAGTLALGGGTVLSVACGSTKDLVKWTNVVIQSLKDISPILSEMGLPSVVNLVARAIPVAEKLKKAIQDNDNASTLELLDNLINPSTGLIVQIAREVGGLNPGNPNTKIVLGILAIGQVALHLIVANIESQVSAPDIAAAKASNPTATAALQQAAQKNALKAAFEAAKF